MATDRSARGRDGAEPRRIGPYRLLERLGEGGMGIVHLALDPKGRAVALKELRPHVALDDAARARFAREVDTLERVDSPAVAAVIDADLDADIPYIVTEWIDGPPLDSVIEEAGPLDRESLAALAVGLADALEGIHDLGIIHRDVKPANVLLAADGPVLIDFGIAHLSDDVRMTRTGMVMGTPGYLAPEVIDGHDVTPETDWWGWAATLAYAAAGAPPFGGGPMEVVLSRVAAGEPRIGDVEPRLRRALTAALAPHPADRPHRDDVIAVIEGDADVADATAVIAPVGAETELLSAVAEPTQAVDAGPTATQVVGVKRTALMPTRARSVPAIVEDEPGYQSDDARAFVGDVDDGYGAQPWALNGSGGGPRGIGPYPPAPDGELAPADPSAVGGDPRAGRPRRTGLLIALGAVFVALSACLPVVALLAIAAWSIIARSVDTSIRSLTQRRQQYGPRRRDIPVAVVSGPWHLLLGVVTALIALLPALFIGACTAFAAAFVRSVLSAEDTLVGSPLPLAAGAVLVLFVAWWGPASPGLREGSRSLARSLAPTTAASQVLTAAALLGALALAGFAASRGTSWTPLIDVPWEYLVVPRL